MGRYEAIELSPAAEEARKHLDALYTEPLRTLQSKGGIKDGAFDTVIMSHVRGNGAASAVARTNTAKQGGTCLGHPIRGPEALRDSARTVLVNSIDFADSICADICRLFPNASHPVVHIGDLF